MQKPAGYFQLDRAVTGMAAACTALNIPVVSGNVSLYNETSASAVMPTPMVGVVGPWRCDPTRFNAGETRRPIVPPFREKCTGSGRSSYLAEIHGVTAGRPPALDLVAELAVQEAALKLIGDGLVSAAHDCSDGGLAIAVAEMAIVQDCGVIVNPDTKVSGRLFDERWFGEAHLASCLRSTHRMWTASRMRDGASPNHLWCKRPGQRHLFCGLTITPQSETIPAIFAARDGN